MEIVYANYNKETNIIFSEILCSEIVENNYVIPKQVGNKLNLFCKVLNITEGDTFEIVVTKYIDGVFTEELNYELNNGNSFQIITFNDIFENKYVITFQSYVTSPTGTFTFITSEY